MANEVRQRMAEGAALLLAKRGPQGTAFSDVIELTGAPRGSIYHHFPEGKDQLLDAALDVAAGRALAVLESLAGKPPREVTAGFIDVWRSVLTRSDYEAGCAVVAVTVSNSSAALVEHAASVFRSWRARLADLLAEGGMADAAREAALLVAACEGAVVIARAERSMQPFELTAEGLLARY